MLQVKWLHHAPYQDAGWYICTRGKVEGQTEPCLNVLDGPFITQSEACSYAVNNSATLWAAHREIEACGPTLAELNQPENLHAISQCIKGSAS